MRDSSTVETSAILSRLNELEPALYCRALEVRDAAATKLARVVEVFPHYTAHDITHKSRVLEIAHWLAGSELIKQLNAQELFVLSAAIFLHDVGMAVAPAERVQIQESTDYISFRQSVDLNDNDAFAEWIRRDHHRRSSQVVLNFQDVDLNIRDTALAHATSLLCHSHGERDLEDFNKYDPYFAYGTSSTTICLPLLGVILRLSDLLHVTSDRTPPAVIPFVRLESEKSREEWQKHLSTVGVARLPSGKVRLSAICDSPDTHRSLLRLCDYINDEFKFANRVVSKLMADGRCNCELACDQVQPNITASGYEPWLDLVFQVDKEGIIRLVTGERLYPSRSAAVYELLMNAVDASRQLAISGGESPDIDIVFSSSDRTLSVSDCGVGMNKEDIEKFLLRIGKCIYKSEIYDQRYGTEGRIDAISEFGIGFASCFLVSDHVVLETKRKDSEGYVLDLYDLMGFAAARRSSRKTTGTKVTLHLHETAIEETRSLVKSLRGKCPHLEMRLNVDIDGQSETIKARESCVDDSVLLRPYFFENGIRLVGEHRHLSKAVDSVNGCLRLVCHDESGVVVPGGLSQYKMTGRSSRHISQLGFKIPAPSGYHDGLLFACNTHALLYDLDLSGSMRLELDPSRSRVINSAHNSDVINSLDNHLVSYIYDLHNKYWASLPREERFKVHRELGKIFFNRAMSCSNMRENKPIVRLIDLMLENMPFKTISAEGEGDLTWNEIRAKKAEVICYHLSMSPFHHKDTVQAMSDAFPEAIIICHEEGTRLVHHLRELCRTVRLYVCELSQSVFPVMMPLAGDLTAIRAARWEHTGNRIVPFVGSGSYAIASSLLEHRAGGVHSWINIEHPKILAFLRAIATAGNGGSSTSACQELIGFLGEYHGGRFDDPEFINYVHRNQFKALDEMVKNGHVSASNRDALLLNERDFVPWDDTVSHFT